MLNRVTGAGQKQVRLAWHLAAAVLVALLLCSIPRVLAEPLRSDEATLKAAFTVRFLKYTEFPGPPSLIRLCAAGNDEIIEALLDYHGTVQGGTRLEVAEYEPARARECSALFLSTEAMSEWPTIRALLSRAALTVGDDETFLAKGGIIEIRRTDNSLAFAVSIKSANEAGLKVSSKLLRLAAEVVE